MDIRTIIGWVLLILLGLPVFGYIVARLWSAAYFRSKIEFLKDNFNKENHGE